MTTTTTPSLTKEQVVAWLRSRAESYRADAAKLAEHDEPSLRAVAPEYRTFARILDTEASHFEHHGPLPALPATWYANPQSSTAKCPDWPAGCGERTRRRASSVGSVLRHRAGCPVEQMTADE